MSMSTVPFAQTTHTVSTVRTRCTEGAPTDIRLRIRTPPSRGSQTVSRAWAEAQS